VTEACFVTIEGQVGFGQHEEDCSLLQAALRAGAGLPYECSSGGCGACKFELLSGEVEDLWPDAPGLSARDRRKGLRLACQNRALGPATIRTRITESCAPRIRPKVMRLELAAIRDLTRDIREFSFRSDGPSTFLPGQYALLRAGADVRRCYSMSNLPNSEGVWQFQIKRAPNGRMSNILFSMQLGQSLVADAPYGMAHLVTDSVRRVVCIAGGSGLAPMISIARAVGASPDRRLDFFYGGRTAVDICGEAQLSSLPGFGLNLNYFPVVSDRDDPLSSGWTGLTGLVHEAVAQRIGAELRDAEIYFAGPPPMADALLRMLMLDLKAPSSQIHYDRFF
jgi:toluene monooxygenase electron transfer component